MSFYTVTLKVETLADKEALQEVLADKLDEALSIVESDLGYTVWPGDADEGSIVQVEETEVSA